MATDDPMVVMSGDDARRAAVPAECWKVTLVPLYAGRTDAVRGYALCDWDDWDGLMAYRWRSDSGGYVVRTSDDGLSMVSMHRQLMSFPTGWLVDHINGNRADNRRGNLRLADPATNAQNRTRTSGASRFRGVSFRKDTGRWKAGITLRAGRLHIDAATEDQAARIAELMRQRFMPGANPDAELAELDRSLDAGQRMALYTEAARAINDALAARRERRAHEQAAGVEADADVFADPNVRPFDSQSDLLDAIRARTLNP